eukprot:CAMPEP_0194775288 /NCGR_PEP_ID=MMETSP0323_2-20130528/59987_1 /TAXON_ID=2866 ORGANISM="Crypthecodinium cohnii, Strain Seligo" /NCGR_SAMPLE_ID=MMETSP0323_2 /ASSEMBLY_ACC=CAM_ASM_000346 /LENGTH=115 /DNA_ID=CAMNT_0039711209 /DNA_START=69 /DNA_END=416 /DNA_ORIENTATION=+
MEAISSSLARQESSRLRTACSSRFEPMKTNSFLDCRKASAVQPAVGGALAAAAAAEAEDEDEDEDDEDEDEEAVEGASKSAAPASLEELLLLVEGASLVHRPQWENFAQRPAWLQ